MMEELNVAFKAINCTVPLTLLSLRHLVLLFGADSAEAHTLMMDW